MRMSKKAVDLKLYGGAWLGHWDEVLRVTGRLEKIEN